VEYDNVVIVFLTSGVESYVMKDAQSENRANPEVVTVGSRACAANNK